MDSSASCLLEPFWRRLCLTICRQHLGSAPRVVGVYSTTIFITFLKQLFDRMETTTIPCIHVEFCRGASVYVGAALLNMQRCDWIDLSGYLGDLIKSWPMN